LIILFKSNYGNFEIPIPDGYEVLPVGSIILDGDLFLDGGIEYYPERNLIEWKPFMSASLLERTVSNEQLIIRPMP
jgi:hypothetical protein